MLSKFSQFHCTLAPPDSATDVLLSRPPHHVCSISTDRDVRGIYFQTGRRCLFLFYQAVYSVIVSFRIARVKDQKKMRTSYQNFERFLVYSVFSVGSTYEKFFKQIKKK